MLEFGKLMMLVLSFSCYNQSEVNSTYEVSTYWLYRQHKACVGCKTCDVCKIGPEIIVEYASYVVREASKYNIDPMIPATQIWLESKIDKNALGPGKERGLMQIAPKYCKSIHPKCAKENLFDPERNIECGLMAMHWWKSNKKYKDRWLDHNADGIYLSKRNRQKTIFKMINYWRPRKKLLVSIVLKSYAKQEKVDQVVVPLVVPPITFSAIN